MKATAKVCLPFSSEKILHALILALTPEVKKQIGMRSKVSLSHCSQVLTITVTASDTVALRAALNSYLRWINSTINILELIEKNQ